MISSFLVGVIGAISHHVLYSTFNGRAVQFDFEQQLVSSTGTALAFLVKVLLAVSSGTAFTQCMWYSVRSRPVEIREMDAMFGVLGNPLQFLNLRFWLGHPVLTFIATTTWLIPLSAIFSSATLSVGPRDHVSSQLLMVSQRDNDDPQSDFGTTEDGSWLYPGESVFMNHLSLLNLAEGDMLPIPAGSGNQNLSYSLNFHGPALGCVEADPQTSEFVVSAMADAINATGELLYWTGWLQPLDFANLDGSFFENIGNGQNLSAPFPGLNLPSSGSAPGSVYFTQYFSENATGLPTPGGVIRVVNCSLHNASYQAHFELHDNGKQTITSNRTLLNGLPVSGTLPSSLSILEAAEIFNDQAIMQMFGFFTTGSTTFPNRGSPLGSITLGNLIGSPILGAAITPNLNFYLNFEQLTSSLEGLFQNFTFSFRYGQLPGVGSDSTADFTSSIATNATFHRSLNTFSYAPRGLVIPYGLAVFLASLSLAFGLSAIYSNKLTYTNNFSTILRMTRDKAFDASIEDEEDCSGADPLPEHIASVVVAYADGTQDRKVADSGLGVGIRVLDHV